MVATQIGYLFWSRVWGFSKGIIETETSCLQASLGDLGVIGLDIEPMDVLGGGVALPRRAKRITLSGSVSGTEEEINEDLRVKECAKLHV